MGDEVYNRDGGRRWQELPPCQHIVQFYDDDRALVDCLAGFVAGGLCCGDAVILILSPGHREALEERLMDFETLGHFSIAESSERDQYIVLDAAETLASFMVDGEVDQGLFTQVVTSTLARGRAAGWWGGDGRRVRVFGEMVALLWAQGNTRATLQLENVWNGLCAEQGFSLLCGYPKSLITSESDMSRIAAAHSEVLA